MKGGTVRLAGMSGLAWGVLVLALWIAHFLMPGGGAILDLVGIAALAALITMLYFLSTTYADRTSKFACYAAICFALALALLPLFGFGGRVLPLVLRILFGLSLLGVGLSALLQGGGVPWTAFAILLIAAGALRAVYGEFVYPIMACAAGVSLFIASAAGRTRSG
jgi:predicted membrane protein